MRRNTHHHCNRRRHRRRCSGASASSSPWFSSPRDGGRPGGAPGRRRADEDRYFRRPQVYRWRVARYTHGGRAVGGYNLIEGRQAGPFLCAEAAPMRSRSPSLVELLRCTAMRVGFLPPAPFYSGASRTCFASMDMLPFSSLPPCRNPSLRRSAFTRQGVLPVCSRSCYLVDLYESEVRPVCRNVLVYQRLLGISQAECRGFDSLRPLPMFSRGCFVCRRRSFTSSWKSFTRWRGLALCSGGGV